MGVWTETEFQRISTGVRLSQRTLIACKAVLVDGLSGVDAAAQNKMFPSQISRGLGVLREHQAELVKSAEVLKEEGALFKYTAAAVAKNMVGEGLIIVDAQPGEVYEGRVIVNTHGFVVQQVGRSGVMHDLGKLEKVPTLNVLLTIAYPNISVGRTIATVTEHSLTNKVAVEKGRQ